MTKNELKLKRRKSHVIAWVITVFLSAVLIFFGNKIATKDLDLFTSDNQILVAEVTELSERIDDVLSGSDYKTSIQIFIAKVIKGPRKGELVVATQQTDNFSAYQEDEVKVGDKITLYIDTINTEYEAWVFGGFYRINTMVWMGVLFLILLLIFGRIKGLNTIVSLGLTVLFVFCVFVPSCLSGFNIYLMTVITCLYTIVMTLIVVNGPSIKSLTTIAGCSFGVSVAAILNILLTKIMNLSGVVDEHSVYLQMLGNGRSLDLKALIFAMTTIGAMGAVMDVAMDISSSLSEIYLHNPQLSFRKLFRSGMRIGRDIMGTMANTLVLAYVGSSLCSTLLYITYASSLLDLFNREGIIVELLQSLVGSMAILLTIPLTSFICSMLYSDNK